MPAVAHAESDARVAITCFLVGRGDELTQSTPEEEFPRKGVWQQIHAGLSACNAGRPTIHEYEVCQWLVRGHLIAAAHSIGGAFEVAGGWLQRGQE